MLRRAPCGAATTLAAFCTVVPMRNPGHACGTHACRRPRGAAVCSPWPSRLAFSSNTPTVSRRKRWNSTSSSVVRTWRWCGQSCFFDQRATSTQRKGRVLAQHRSIGTRRRGPVVGVGGCASLGVACPLSGGARTHACIKSTLQGGLAGGKAWRRPGKGVADLKRHASCGRRRRCAAGTRSCSSAPRARLPRGRPWPRRSWRLWWRLARGTWQRS